VLEDLSKEQIEGILEALPIDMLFVDENEILRYYNKANKESRKHLTAILGKDIRNCHKKESHSRVEELISNLKSGKKDEEEFWVSYNDRMLNRFIAVKDREGKYLGMIEYIFDFKKLERLAEEKKEAYKISP
jgi:uncharacterized protein